MPDQEKLEQAAAELKEEAADVVLDKAEEIQAEEDLEKATDERLNKTFVTGEKLEVQPDPSEKSDDSTPEEKPAEESDDKDGPTAAEKKEEVKLEAAAKEKEDDKEADDIVKDEKVDEGKSKKEEIPQLSDAYYRAAKHRGWSDKDIKDAYEANPELTVRTLGNIYEAVNRSSKEYAAFGRTHKEQVAAQIVPEPTKGAEKKSEFKGFDIDALRKQYPDDPIVDLVAAQQAQSEALFNEVQEIKIARSAPATGQPSGLSAQQVRAEEQEAAAIEQQIEAFFKNDSLKGYEEFYGSLPKDAVVWDTLTPGQKMNRWTVVEMMDQIIVGSRTLGREINIDEALNRAHLSVSEPIREKVIRNDIKAQVSKRGSNLTLKPSGTAQPGETKPQTKQELESVTKQRLDKVFNG